MILEQEEIYWVQRARANWLKHGDRNSNFFQNYTTQRKMRNNIKYLIDDSGVKHEDRVTIKLLVQNYFMNLFSSEVAQVDPAVLGDVASKVMGSMNQDLLAPYT